jgi:hypothetical protein
MPSKYDAIFPKLKKMEFGETDEDPRYQDKVNAVKAEWLANGEFDPSADGLAKNYALCRKVVDEVKAMLYLANIEVQAAEQMLITSYENGHQGWGTYGSAPDTIRTVTGDKMKVQPEPYTKIVDKSSFYKWVFKSKLDSLMVFPWQTANKHAKDLLMKGQPPPDGTEVKLHMKIVYTPFKAQELEEVE